MAATKSKFRKWPNGLSRRLDEDYERPLERRSGALTPHTNMPLVHVTNAWSAKEILKKKKFLTKTCDVFKKGLVYFFVLRPAYRTVKGSEKSRYLDYFPVAFILKADAVPMPFHVYPFDTGGAAKGAFKSNANALIPLEDYALAPSHSAAKGFIGWAFGSLENYFDAILRPGLSTEIHAMEGVETSYVAIAKMGVTGDAVHDTRASTIEIASDDNVDVPGNILLVIAPKPMLEIKSHFSDAIAALSTAGADVRLYDWQPNRAPNDYQRDLLRISRDWYRKQNILS